MNRQVDCVVFMINVGEFSFNFVVNVQNQGSVFNVVMGCFRSMQVIFNVVSQFYGCVFSVNCSYFIGYDSVFFVQSNLVVEWIFCELFNVQGDMFMFCVNLQNNCSDFVVFFVFMNCFFVCNVSGDVRQVNQVVDVVVQVDEDIEVSDRFDFIFNMVVFVVGFCELLLWVSFVLFQIQGDMMMFFVDIQNYNFYYIVNVNNFGWVDVFVGLIYFGNVYQVFNVFFDFNEVVVVGQVGYVISQFGIFWIMFSDSYLWIFVQLFQVQGYMGMFVVEFQYFNSDFVVYVDDFVWMFNVFSGYVSDVQQVVNVVQINECIVVSEVFNDIFNFYVFLQVFQQLIVFCVVFGFDNGMMRNNNVVVFLIQFDYFKFKFFVFQVQSVMYWMNVYQRIWQECMNIVQFNSEVVFNFVVDNIGNSFSIFVSFFQCDSGFVMFSFFMGQQSFIEVVFYCVQSNVNFVIYLDFQFVLGVFELFSWDGGFRFQISVNQYYVFVDSNNNVMNDRIWVGFDFF